MVEEVAELAVIEPLDLLLEPSLNDLLLLLELAEVEEVVGGSMKK